MPEYEQNKVILLPEGDYPFKVVNAKETVSKSGNDMIELTLNVGGEITLIDRLVFTPNAYWRIDDFRRATGEVLGTGRTSFEAEHCIGRTGFVHLGTEDDINGKERNIVQAYLPKGAVKAAAAKPVTATAGTAAAKVVGKNELGEPDDLPF